MHVRVYTSFTKLNGSVNKYGGIDEIRCQLGC